MSCGVEWLVATVIVVGTVTVSLRWHAARCRPRYEEYAKLRALAEHIAEEPGYGMMPRMRALAAEAVAFPRWHGGATYE